MTFGTHTYEPVLGVTAHFDRVLEGFPVREINRAWETMYQNSRFWNRYGIGIAVMGGISMAMYDLLGKLLELPVYQLLGGLLALPHPGVREQRALHDGRPAHRRRAARPGRGVRRLQAPRDRSTDRRPDRGGVPGGAGTRDGCHGRRRRGGGAAPWSVSISQKIAKGLEPHEPLWLEEPVRVENLDGYVEMRQATTVNIAGAESLPTAYAFRPYLERGAFDIVQFDIATSGFTEGARIASLAAVHEKPVAIHSWGTLVTIMAGIHFGLVTPNCAITEFNFTEHPLNDLLAVARV